MPHSDNLTRLRHMLDVAEELIRITTGKTFDDLLIDRGLQLISIRCLEIIGEAAANIDQDFRDKHAEVPWRPIIAMRNRLMHGYFDIELTIVWNTAFKYSRQHYP